MIWNVYTAHRKDLLGIVNEPDEARALEAAKVRYGKDSKGRMRKMYVYPCDSAILGFAKQRGFRALRAGR